MTNLSLVLDHSGNGKNTHRPMPALPAGQGRRTKQQRSVQVSSSGPDHYKAVHGQCKTWGETTHVTSNSKHEKKVQYFTCNAVGHKSKHHVRPGE